MQPILRLITGKTASSKYHYRTRYAQRIEDRPSAPTPGPGSIPLSSKPSDLSPGSERRFATGKNDTMFTATSQAVDDGQAEDERSIFRQAPWRHRGSSDEREGRIQRVDEISVSFEADDGGKVGQTRARPVAAPGQGPWRWR